MNNSNHGLHHLPVWLGVLLITMLLSGAYLLDGPSEIETAQAVSGELQEAIESVATSARIERARGRYDHQTTLAAVAP